MSDGQSDADTPPEHEVVHRNPLGEAVCRCGVMFEPGTLAYFWPAHIRPDLRGHDGTP